jgi:hypothetical protein
MVTPRQEVQKHVITIVLPVEVGESCVPKQVPGTKLKYPWNEDPRSDEVNFYNFIQHTLEYTRQRLGNNSFVICKAVVKSLFQDSLSALLITKLLTLPVIDHSPSVQTIMQFCTAIYFREDIRQEHQISHRRLLALEVPCRINCLWLYLHRCIECWR